MIYLGEIVVVGGDPENRHDFSLQNSFETFRLLDYPDRFIKSEEGSAE
jgi:hypothetical protein